MTSNAPAAEHSERATAMRQGRQADSARRRQRVLAALNRAATDGTEMRREHRPCRRGRSQFPLPPPRPARPDPRPGGNPTAGRVRPGAGRHPRLAARRPARRRRSRATAHQPYPATETRLSEALGEQAWRESGLGVPADLDALNQKINNLEQQSIDLRLQLAERDQDLAAARAANRELMAQLNTLARHR